MGVDHTGQNPAGTGAQYTNEQHREASEAEEAGPMLTTAETATRLGVSTMTVYRLIRSGTLTALRVGAVYRIPERVVLDFLGELHARRQALQRPRKP